MPGTFSPTADFKGNRKLAIPTCITARAWRTCRDACRDRAPAVTGKTLPAFPAHAHLQFCVSGKRPMPTSVCITTTMNVNGPETIVFCWNKLVNYATSSVMFTNHAKVIWQLVLIPLDVEQRNVFSTRCNVTHSKTMNAVNSRQFPWRVHIAC